MVRLYATEIRAAVDAAEPYLHPDTAPAVIRESQLAAVVAYRLAYPLASVAEVADALDLPVWSVECRLAEHRGEPTPYRVDTPGRNPGQTPYREGIA